MMMCKDFDVFAIVKDNYMQEGKEVYCILLLSNLC